MPKIVDHAQRRVELVEATWRLIARHGIEGATMREIASEAGFSNGALKPYFPSKEDLLTFAFEHVFLRTNTRIKEATAGTTGLPALRILCHEVLPLDEDKQNEARIAIAFWQRALNDRSCQGSTSRTISGPVARAAARYLQDAHDAHKNRTSMDIAGLAGILMNMLLGAQITAALSPGSAQPQDLVQQLDALLLGAQLPTDERRPDSI